MFRLPCLLGPPVAPTAVGFAHRAAGPFTPRNGRVVTLHELWHRYIPEPGNWYGGTFAHWNAALSAAPESLRSVYILWIKMILLSILDPFMRTPPLLYAFRPISAFRIPTSTFYFSLL